MIRTYTELLRLHTFEERFRYLALHGETFGMTFGFDRYLNQKFYTSREWRQLRLEVIARDNGCDLAFPGHEIHTKLIIHHMNPMTVEDVKHGISSILDSEFLITTTLRTHNAIHYGNEGNLPKPHVDRYAGDTTLWPPMKGQA